jgi:predicted nucleotidyltransferase
VIAAYLFGSVARGEARPDSDVDVGLVFDRPRPRTLNEMPFDIQDELEAHLGRPVDLVVLDGADPELVHRVLCDGVIAVEHDRARRIQFEVRARNEYFDNAAMRRRYRRQPPQGPT